jgi:hypothetical protein
MTEQQRSTQGRTNSSAQRVAWQREAMRCKALSESLADKLKASEEKGGEMGKQIANLSAEIVAHIQHSAEWRRKCLNEEQAHSRTKYLIGAWRKHCETLTETEMRRRAEDTEEKAKTPF